MISNIVCTLHNAGFQSTPPLHEMEWSCVACDSTRDGYGAWCQLRPHQCHIVATLTHQCHSLHNLNTSINTMLAQTARCTFQTHQFPWFTLASLHVFIDPTPFLTTSHCQQVKDDIWKLNADSVTYMMNFCKSFTFLFSPALIWHRIHCANIVGQNHSPAVTREPINPWTYEPSRVNSACSHWLDMWLQTFLLNLNSTGFRTTMQQL